MDTKNEDTNWKAHSALVKFYDVFNKFRNLTLAAVVACVLIFISITVVISGGSGQCYDMNGRIIEDCVAIFPYHTSISIVLIIGVAFWIFISLGWILRWLLINRKLRRGLIQIRSSFVHRNYVTIFELERPKGETKIDRLCNQLSLVFPEVEEEMKKYEKRGKKFSDGKNLSPVLQDVDFIIPTSAGLILLKIFEETVMFEDVEKITNYVKNIEKFQKFFTDDRASRLIFLGNKYDGFFESEDFIRKMQDLTKDKNFKIDLILEEELGYSTIWIDR